VRQFSDSGPRDIAFAKFAQVVLQADPGLSKENGRDQRPPPQLPRQEWVTLATKDDAAEMWWCEVSGSILNLEFRATRRLAMQWN
jgi:hypothetical protein